MKKKKDPVSHEIVSQYIDLVSQNTDLVCQNNEIVAFGL